MIAASSGMKPSREIFKLSALALLGILAALVTRPAGGAVPDHQLVLTEHSSLSLSATLDHGPLAVTNTSIDNWTVTIPNLDLPTTPQWLEPENSSLINFITFAVEPDIFAVGSEGTGGGPFEPNGGTFVAAGTLTSDGAAVDVTFNDKEVVSHVSDTGSTVGLLFVSLLTLLGAARLCSLKFA
jgi:hypothetical protein